MAIYKIVYKIHKKLKIPTPLNSAILLKLTCRMFDAGRGGGGSSAFMLGYHPVNFLNFLSTL